MGAIIKCLGVDPRPLGCYSVGLWCSDDLAQYKNVTREGKGKGKVAVMGLQSQHPAPSQLRYRALYSEFKSNLNTSHALGLNLFIARVQLPCGNLEVFKPVPVWRISVGWNFPACLL